MADAISLTCPSCGGKLQITNDIDRFACGYCGNEMIVQRGGGIIALKPVVEGLKQVQVGVDKTASELAISRLSREKDELERKAKVFDSRTFNGFILIIVGIGLMFVSFDGRQGLLSLAAIVGGFGLFRLLTALQALKPIKERLSVVQQELQRHEGIVGNLIGDVKLAN